MKATHTLPKRNEFEAGCMATYKRFHNECVDIDTNTFNLTTFSELLYDFFGIPENERLEREIDERAFDWWERTTMIHKYNNA